MKRRDRWAVWVPLITIFLAAFVFWGLLRILPRPNAVSVLEAFLKWRADILFNAQHTLSTTLKGFAISVVAGVGLGLVIGYAAAVYRPLYPLLVAFNGPAKVLVPVLVVWFGIRQGAMSLLVVWFGVGTMPAILTAFLISFFPIGVSVATGLATVEPDSQDALRSPGASRRESFLKAGIRRSLPYFLASLKVAVILALVGAVIVETVVGRGIGFMMLQTIQLLNVSLFYAVLVVFAAMVVALYAIFAIIEKRLTGWAYREQSISA